MFATLTIIYVWLPGLEFVTSCAVLSLIDIYEVHTKKTEFCIETHKNVHNTMQNV